jgi:hypothetical protein
MQGCRKRGKGGKRRAAAKLLCIVSTPPVRVVLSLQMCPSRTVYIERRQLGEMFALRWVNYYNCTNLTV